MDRARHVIWPNQKNLYFSNSYTEFHTGCWHSAGEFAGEAGDGERGRQSGDDWRLLLPPGSEILPVS